MIELSVGFEPTTCSLQVSCTTAVLRELIPTPNIQIKCLSDIDANNKYFIDQKKSVFFKKNNQQNKKHNYVDKGFEPISFKIII